MSIHFDRLQEACKLNNAGTAFLASNDGGSAVKVLKSALVIMESISRDASSEEFIIPRADGSNCLSVEVPGLQDATFFIYNRAIVLDPNSEIDLAFSNAVILFNLALTFHQRGRMCHQETNLRRAIHLYDLVTKLVADVSANFVALALAALNNQAQIYQDLCDYTRARSVLEQVRALSEFVPTPEPDSTSPFESQHFDEIYLNVTIAQPPTTAPSA